MKRISSLAAILLLTVAFMGCEPAETAPEETTNETSQTELELNQVAFGIEGMTWATACVGAVNDALAQVPGVSEAKVDFDNKVIVITKGEGYEDKDVVAAVSGAGNFTANKK
jgi:copper chaperone CopZ